MPRADVAHPANDIGATDGAICVQMSEKRNQEGADQRSSRNRAQPEPIPCSAEVVGIAREDDKQCRGGAHGKGSKPLHRQKRRQDWDSRDRRQQFG